MAAAPTDEAAGVAAASPHKLIVMLYDGALVSILSAITNIKAGNVAAKGAAISKAINIVDNGLRAALDKKVGGEIAQNLDALYEYTSARLLKANLENDPAILEEVHTLLADLRDAWNAIAPQAAPAPAPAQNTALHAPTLMSA